MDHDELCHMDWMPPDICARCALIAAVRQRTLDEAVAVVRLLEASASFKPAGSATWRESVRRDDAVAAITALRQVTP
jgi:hypothetical protein